MNIRIIIPYKSVGLEYDAKIYKKMITDIFPTYTIEISNSNNFKPTKNDDIHIYISNMDEHWLKYAKIKMLMINHELFYQSSDYDEKYNKLDYVLCRNQIGYDWAMKIKLEHGFKYSILLTKFTTIFPTVDIQKHSNLILHSAGEHHWKQTDVIIKTWQKYSDLPLLIITCTNQCFRNVQPILNKGGYPKNIHFHKKLIDYDKFVALKNKAGIHLCPSIVEGYGHYINESRKVKSLVITTNFPPMNELIDDSCGILINCSSFGLKKNGAKLCFVTENDMYVAVKKALDLSYETKQQMINKAHSKFLNETSEFTEKIKELFESLKI